MTYTAITIGPIYDTMFLTSSPAGLWAASYLFSHISQRLCEMLIEKDLVSSAKSILSPYYPTEDEIKKEPIVTDGVGRYHDRIIFQPDNPGTVLGEVQKLFEAAADEIAKAFEGNTKEWFKQYLKLHAICFESTENPILDCSKYLDALELEKSFPTAGDNPLADLLDSSDKNRNITIRNKIRNTFSDGRWPFPDYQNKQGEERLPDMEDITGRRLEIDRPRRKINSYYAIVQTDGDHFSEYIRGCRERKESEREFSKKCLNYCSTSVELVKEYGGLPIYAGGDDLLFIAPMTGQFDGKDSNILGLLRHLRENFEKSFGKSQSSPTLSLGLAIRYYKYPLYEAFSEAVSLLFEDAKKKRNSAAISLQKHSGQTIAFVLERFNVLEDGELFKYLVESNLQAVGEEEVLESIRGKIWEFEELFCVALSKFLADGGKALDNAFHNTFDAEIHQGKQELTTTLNLLKYLKANDSTHTMVHTLPPWQINGRDEADKPYPEERAVLHTLDTLLRFAKFWREKGDDGDV